MIPHEIGRLIADDRIGRSMGLIEGIAGKIHHLIEDGVGHLLTDAVADAPRHHHLSLLVHQAIDEVLSFLFHDIMLLLAHGSSDQV